MKKKFCILVTKLTFGKVCFGWCVEPIESKKEVKKTPKKKTTKKGTVLAKNKLKK